MPFGSHHIHISSWDGWGEDNEALQRESPEHRAEEYTALHSDLSEDQKRVKHTKVAGRQEQWRVRVACKRMGSY